MRRREKARPILRRVQHSYDHDRSLIRLVEDQVVAKLRHHKPADLRVTRSGLADASPDFRMLREKVGGVENDLSHALRRFGIVGGDVTAMTFQIAFSLGTEPGANHDWQRRASVVLA